ncbi:MAG: hypothetical protein KBT20_08375 [Bacteroidales bacterium]|nr:hypothetical protein [Candidatus Liminaster caballi]
MRILACLSILTAIYLLADTFVFLEVKVDLVTVATGIVLRILAPILPWVTLLFLWSLYSNSQKFDWKILLCFILPLSNGILSLISCMMLGVERTADFITAERIMPADISMTDKLLYKMFDVCTIDIHEFLIFGSLDVLLGYMIYLLWSSNYKPGDIFRFLFRGGRIRPLHLQIFAYAGIFPSSALRMFVDRSYYLDNPWMAVALFVSVGIGMCLYGWLGLQLDKPLISLRRQDDTFFEDLPVHIERKHEFDDEEEDSLGYNALNLRKELHVIMREKECYRMPGMSRYAVSSMLGISTHVLDNLLHHFHGVNYNQYVDIQRVAYLSRYRKAHPNTPLPLLAAQCGFHSIGLMMRTYKEVAGENY